MDVFSSTFLPYVDNLSIIHQHKQQRHKALFFLLTNLNQMYMIDVNINFLNSTLIITELYIEHSSNLEDFIHRESS